MKAIVRQEYGGPDRLAMGEIDRPVVGDTDVLVRVRALSVNPYDLHHLSGLPYLIRLGNGLLRPKLRVLGVDFAGEVAAVGPAVTRFRPGDAVYGQRMGAFAEYVAVAEDKLLVPKPDRLSFEQAAAIPVAGLSALQGLRDHGNLHSGQSVLVNGAAGGVGTFAVQIAKAYGAHVTGVCGPRNVDLVRSLGADEVMDYTKENFTQVNLTQSGRRYGQILDMIGNHRVADRVRVLTPDGVIVVVGGPEGGRLLGPMATMIRSRLASRRVRAMFTQPVRADLETINDLVEAGQVTPVIDRTHPLAEVADALTYLGRGHARGKVVISVP